MLHVLSADPTSPFTGRPSTSGNYSFERQNSALSRAPSMFSAGIPERDEILPDPDAASEVGSTSNRGGWASTSQPVPSIPGTPSRSASDLSSPVHIFWAFALSARRLPGY